MQQKYLTIDDFRATYVSGHFNQTIFVEYPVSSDAQVDWKEITSKLRLKRGEYPQKDFGLVVCNDLKLGYGEECEKLSDETTIFSGGSNSCSEYKPLIYGSGNIMCNTTTCKIDNSSCESLPTCTDEKQNQDETDKDCGGSKCSACNNGLNCTLNTDCQSGYCNSSSKKCANEPVPVNLCGNSQINTETEECDDGNQDDGDGCSSKCKKEYKSIIQDNVQPQCYQTADYECSQFNSDSDKCTELDRCTFSNGVPPSSQDSCSPKSNIECTSILNEQTCKSNTYCSWGIPKCSLNPTYCSTITSEAECNLYSFCDYLTDSNRCALAEYPTHQDNCVGASFPKGNSMCLENLCVWVDDYLLL
ncbi:DUF4215 domain-containing protein [Candidatus Woesearchaeota archaeon]|nr:DUF4215 domain-containing protein [Candidatus Woesearchaeota archaeon]MCF7901073.1 DUF4215 domain-containing protein [Candidatus Woesearchaeota archaeon]MCF8013624.1 DUF4215 domain-containing protein [Candidatus Woesearchaeota archaeon]